MISGKSSPSVAQRVTDASTEPGHGEPIHSILGNVLSTWNVDRLTTLLAVVAEPSIADAPQRAKAAVAAAPRPPRQALQPLNRTDRPIILVVDDECCSFDLIEDIFEDRYTVISAKDGMEALYMASIKAPDLILLDVMMPGMDGYEVCRRLKAEPLTRDIPVIFITGRGDAAAETRGLELGAIDYIAKPINPASIRARVNNQISLKCALDKLTRVAALEQALREDILEVLEIKTRDERIH